MLKVVKEKSNRNMVCSMKEENRKEFEYYEDKVWFIDKFMCSIKSKDLEVGLKNKI